MKTERLFWSKAITVCDKRPMLLWSFLSLLCWAVLCVLVWVAL